MKRAKKKRWLYLLVFVGVIAALVPSLRNRITSDVQVLSASTGFKIGQPFEIESKVCRNSGLLVFRGRQSTRSPAGSEGNVSSPVSDDHSWLYWTYSLVDERPSRAEEASWIGCEGSISRCSEKSAPIADFYGRAEHEKPTAVVLGDTKVPTAGLRFIGHAVSPSGRFVAHLSADPDKQFSIMWLGNVRGSSAQHYHQILDLERRAWIGDPLRIGIVTVDGSRQLDRTKPFEICWSPDERFVIYVLDDSVAVVSVGFRGKND